MHVTAEIDLSEIIEALTLGTGDNDPIAFITALDESIADEGFTNDLLLRLAQSYEQEYIEYEEGLMKRALEATFGDADPARLFTYHPPTPEDIQN
jgi:hypothetical protein